FFLFNPTAATYFYSLSLHDALPICNLWIFINRYSTFFLFILFFGIAFFLVIRNNTFQRASVLNSSNQLIGRAYQQIDYFKGYLRSEEHTSELQSRENLVCRLLLEKK